MIDTPGQIEVFTWSASGTIITEALVSVGLVHESIWRVSSASVYCLGLSVRWRGAALHTWSTSFSLGKKGGRAWEQVMSPKTLLILRFQASSFPTVVIYVMDTSRSTNPVTFMSNMLYACR